MDPRHAKILSALRASQDDRMQDVTSNASLIGAVALTWIMQDPIRMFMFSAATKAKPGEIRAACLMLAAIGKADVDE